VGIVEAGTRELKGKTVFCLHPHQDYFVVPSDAVAVLPEGLPPGRAILAANMETAINGLWDAKPLAGERIAVIGAGVVGILVGCLASRIPGAKVQLVDPVPEKAKVAAAFGIACVSETEAETNADLVIHASGNPAGLETALELAGFEGRIVEMSWFGNARVSLPLGEGFHAKRLRIISSQVGHVPAELGARWDRRRRMSVALEILRDPAFDALIASESVLADLPRMMSRIAEDQTILCHRINYD
jgi:threonine dehydrogenase-like Zn-dependent dehydrogenase